MHVFNRSFRFEQLPLLLIAIGSEVPISKYFKIQTKSIYVRTYVRTASVLTTFDPISCSVQSFLAGKLLFKLFLCCFPQIILPDKMIRAAAAAFGIHSRLTTSTFGQKEQKRRRSRRTFTAIFYLFLPLSLSLSLSFSLSLSLSLFFNSVAGKKQAIIVAVYFAPLEIPRIFCPSRNTSKNVFSLLLPFLFSLFAHIWRSSEQSKSC